jgi:hypothetical protein
MMSLYDLEPDLYPSAAVYPLNRSMAFPSEPQAEGQMVKATSIAALMFVLTILFFIIHAVSDVNTGMMIWHWLKSLLG